MCPSGASSTEMCITSSSSTGSSGGSGSSNASSSSGSSSSSTATIGAAVGGAVGGVVLLVGFCFVGINVKVAAQVFFLLHMKVDACLGGVGWGGVRWVGVLRACERACVRACGKSSALARILNKDQR